MLYYTSTDVSPTDESIKVTLYVGWQDMFELPALYVAHAIDASIIVKKEWEMKYHKNETVIRAMKILSPGYIRFGGIMSDHTVFVEKRPENFR